MALKAPTNQVRLTNVAVVRYKAKGLRFEVACYKNKVQSYRAGNESDLDEVLQSHTIFANVSKGSVANRADIVEAFGDLKSNDDIVKLILDKGDVQISEKERTVERDQAFKVMNAKGDVVDWLSVQRSGAGRQLCCELFDHATAA
jgi:ribosome maturation protein SDO1